MPEARLERSDQLAGRASPSAFSARNLPTCRYYPGCPHSGYESRALNFRTLKSATNAVWRPLDLAASKLTFVTGSTGLGDV